MRNIQILGTLILCLCGLMLVPNHVSSQSLTRNSALEVIVDESSNAYFNIHFAKGETLYSICKEFHIATIDAMMLNEIVNPDQISIGEELILPLNKEFFRVKQPTGSNYIPVYYKVKKQETLFRISKVYFAQDVKDMIERNQMSGFTLSIGEKLLVGYYQTAGTLSTDGTHLATANDKPTPAIKIKTETVTTTSRPAVEAPASKPANGPTQSEYTLVETNITTETYQQEVHTQNHHPDPTASEDTAVHEPVTVIQETAITKKEEVESVPQVSTYKFQPDTKERFKKVIGSEKLDHSVSETKYDRIQEEIIEGNADAEVVLDTEETTSVDTVQTTLPVDKPTSNLVSQSRKGIAYWDKKGKDYENLMVLHKSAEVNTLIKLTNPVNGLSTFARVVGKIPENAFKKDIDVVLSPAVARKIGAIDSRMQISMTYQIIKP